jgi:prevent-host-death family protein
MKTISVSEVKSHLSEYLSRAAAGERFVVLRRDRPVAALISVTELERLERSSQTANRLALALGQQADLLKQIEAGELHPIMAAFGLWREEEGLADLSARIIQERHKQPGREVEL